MGPGKSSSLVTTLSNRTSLLQGDRMEGEWGSPGWRSDHTIAGNQDFIPEAGAWFQPSRNFTEGCRTWDPKGYMYDVLSGSSPVGYTLIQITAMLLDMSDRLQVVITS
jgi:hypothetical protein